jgi:hypothetical protein
VQEAVEPTPLLRVFKDESSQRLSVEGAIGQEHVATKGFNDRREALGSRRDHIPGELVGIDDRKAEGPETSRYR